MALMPMFPLGSVLLPGGILPLHVFEPRFRDMVRDCLRGDGDPEFGQTLITHGWETGGGDDRAMVGTVARMLQVDAIDENRYAVVAVGTRRIRVNSWLPDNPYPLADVDEWPDEWPDDAPDLTVEFSAARTRVRAVRALAAEVALRGRDAAPEITEGDVEFPADPESAIYHLVALAPIGPADRFRLLAAPGPVSRLGILAEILDDVEAMLKFRLS